MKYVYNAERDRLAIGTGGAHFIRASYVNVKTGEEREMLLHVVSSSEKQHCTVAGRNAHEDEKVTGITVVNKRVFTEWLCAGRQYAEYGGMQIPADYITDFLVTESRKSAGDLSAQKEGLEKNDESLFKRIAASYELSKEYHDIVREIEDPERDF